jgi:hypothetical protein
MSMLHAVFGVIAGIIAFIAYLPYIHSILRGETKPNRATFLIWSTVDIVLIASYLASGARTTIWTSLVFCVFQVVVLILSFRSSTNKFTRLDIACIGGAGLGLLLWLITRNAQTALYVSILCEILGFIPTIKKAYLQPDSESKIAWSLGVGSSVCNLIAINKWQLAIMIYPIYNFIFVGLVAALLVFPHRRLRKTPPQLLLPKV